MTTFHVLYPYNLFILYLVICTSFYISLEKEMATALQYSFLENPMDGGAWQAAVHGVTKSRTRLSDFTNSLTYLAPPPTLLPTGNHWSSVTVNFLCLFFNFWMLWVFVAVHKLFSSYGEQGLLCIVVVCGFFLLLWLLLWSLGSRHRSFSSCGSRALES